MLSIGGKENGTILQTISQNAEGFDRLSMAVSYVQLSGWEMIAPLLEGKYDRVRLICTDQMGITDPLAVKAMTNVGVTVHAYNGKRTYHPKLIIIERNDEPSSLIVGSANLSRSALDTSVEAAFTTTDDSGEALAWFEDIFANQSEAFDEARLKALEVSHAARLKGALAAAKADPSFAVEAETSVAAGETIEASFASLPNIVVPLNADKAGNNVRTLRRIKELLDDPAHLEGKALSEFKLIGLAQDGGLSAIGNDANGRDLSGIAAVWMNWLKHATADEVNLANPSGRLLQARVAFETFWSFPEEVRDYFLDHAENPTHEIRPHLQTIELLANTGKRMPGLTVNDVKTLSQMLAATSQLSPRVERIVRDYLGNKGTRGWREPDRALILRAWQQA